MSRRRDLPGMYGGRKDRLDLRIYNTNGSRNTKAELAREKEKTNMEVKNNV